MVPRPRPLPRRAAAYACVVLTGLLLATTPGCSGETEARGRTNVVLVTIDTLRADHTSLHGYDLDTTPALDRYAEGGTVFERAWSMSSWTLPSMGMLLMGRVRLENSGRIVEENPPLAERLEERGYATAAIVSNPLLRPQLGFDRGFQHFERPRQKAGDPWWIGDVVVDKGLAWLEGRDDDAPFFLFLHLTDPHGPYEPERGIEFPVRDDPARRAAFLAACEPDERAGLTDEVYATIESKIAAYDSEVLQADRALARLWDWLEDHDLADDTLVVITADHGEGLWQRHKEAGEIENGPSFFKPLLQGHGTQVYSEQVHVPLVLRGPGVPRGERVTEDVCLLDVLPTIFGRLGSDIPSDLDGRDLFGGEPAPREIHTMCSRVSSVTLDGRWRLHVPAAYRVEKLGLAPELFDLAEDPLELEPLDDPSRTADLLQRMEDYRVTYAASGERAEIVAEEVEMLRGLGYAGEAAEAERLGAESALPGDEEGQALETMHEEDAGDGHRH